MTCSCGSIGSTELRQCPEHFHIWNGDRRLTSVGSIIRTCWHQGPMPPADVLENARDRGSVVDGLVADYVRGKPFKIPAGTRTDAIELFYKVRNWFDAQHFHDAQVQVVLGDTDYGGVLDFRFDGVPVDLKATYNVEPTAVMQVAGYTDLCGESVGGILHVTERFSSPRWIPITADDIEDWRTMLKHWRMLQRRIK